jgi:O-antigen/teichoic acid export membrane protein
MMSGDVAQEHIDRIPPKSEAWSGSHGHSPPSFFASVVAITGGQLGCIAVASLAELCFARLLGPSSRGLVSLCLMSIAFGALIGSLGSEATVVVWISRSKGRHSTWFPAVVLWVLSGCLLAVSAWAVVYWKWHPVFLKGLTPELALLVLVAIPATVFFSMLMALFVGEERFHLRSLIALLNRISSLAGFFLFVLVLGRRAETAVLGNATGLVVGICVALVFLRHFFRGAWRLGEARENLFPTMIFGIRGQAGNLASFFSYRLDVFVVNYFLDASQVGLYTLGVLVSEALWQLPGIVSVALFPRTARTIGAGADQFTCMILRQVFLITFVVGLVVAAASPIAIPLLFGARYLPSVPVIWWILPGTIALSLGKVIAADLTGRSLNFHLPISASIGFLITILLDLFLIPRMGIQGAALASSIAYLAAAGYLFVVIQRELKTSWTTLVIPTKTEWLAYQRLWLAFRMRFWPESSAR